MKSKLLLWLFIAFSTIFFVSCGQKTEKEKVQTENKRIQEVYMCPMHTDISRVDSGGCPKCGMKLVKVVRKLADTTDKYRE